MCIAKICVDVYALLAPCENLDVCIEVCRYVRKATSLPH